MGLQGLCNFLSMPSIKMEHLSLNSSLGYAVNVGVFFNHTTAFHLSWQDAWKDSSYHTPTAKSRIELETNYASVLRRPTFISIHSDPKELLHCQTHHFAVKHGDFYQCNLVRGWECYSHAQHCLSTKHPWLITAGTQKVLWDLCCAKRHQHKGTFRYETP